MNHVTNIPPFPIFLIDPPMIRKHSATLHGHRTSFSLEDAFWTELKAIANVRGTSLAALISEIDDGRDAESNLSSALRLYVLKWLKERN
ncbi:Predicted DNA-binding protein, contains Ribbon-helix-helix (RHH) domain [Rhizobium lusitanum]|uniref:Predicted DNA-binding protein, contains Ribbon-helix-helix (RHH) domain n=2 Tax=Rhizobium/Agrobacterium group TaxID=227290 RepID=A0A1C3VTN1_9HYPH|nr:Predicted DNA-binding protein, contains Ribbon-helix-helix (RHH) domain [Rhizobium lusitanum]